MSTPAKIMLVLALLYLLGAIATTAYLADQGEARLAAGKPVFKGFGDKATPAVQLAETFFVWPVALAKSTGAAPSSGS